MTGFWMPLILAGFAGFMWCAAYQHTRTALSRRPLGFNHLLFALWATLAALLASGNLFFYLDLSPAQFFLLSRVQVLLAIATVSLFLLFTVRYLSVPVRGFISLLLVMHGLLLAIGIFSEGGGFSVMNAEDIHRAAGGLMQGRLIPSRIEFAWPMHVYNALVLADFAVAFYWAFRRYEKPDTQRARSYLIAVGLYFCSVAIEGVIYAVTGELSNVSLVGVASIVMFMGGSLSSIEREREVLEMNRVLEQRIAERTREVEQALHSLSQEMQEKDALYSQLIQAQKMEAVGQLASGFAHDFNNVLTAIRAYAELAQDEAPAGSELQAYVSQVVAASDRGAQLTGQLQALTREQRANRSVQSLEQLLAQYMAKHPLAPAANIHLAIAVAERLPPVLMDPQQFGQILSRLISNALDAMPDGGELSLSLRVPTAGELPSTLPAGDYVCLSVIDNGCGIDPAIMHRIFEPFFSSRPAERSGLGLAVCYGLVKQNSGYIFVVGQPEGGARFDLYFPVARADAAVS